MSRIEKYFCSEYEWECYKCQLCGRLHKRDEEEEYSDHLCQFRTCPWHRRDIMLAGIDINPLTNQIAVQSVRCPYHLCPYRHFKWHVAETTSPAVDECFGYPRVGLPPIDSKKENKMFIHHDSVFDDPARNVTSHFLVHPDWLSEKINPPKILPLKRKPWPWEQSRHRMNLQIPITYDYPKSADANRDPCVPILPYTPPKATCEDLKRKWAVHF